jgi:hypothetical protein
MKRKGKVPASCFVNTLLFNENDQVNISLPDLTSDLNQVYGIDVSKEALHKKFTPEAVNFLKGLVGELFSGQLQQLIDVELPLHFPQIKIKDSTKFSLPDSYGNDYKGYGNLFPWLVSKRNTYTPRSVSSPTCSKMNYLTIKNASKRF